MNSTTAIRTCVGQQGFTLIELMVGTAIAVIVTGAAFSALTSSSKATRANDQTAQTQQNGRLAMDLLSHDFKMAGYGMSGPVGNCGSAIVPADNDPAAADTGPDSVSLVVPTAMSPLANAITGPFGPASNPVPLVSTAAFNGTPVVSIGGVVSATAVVAGNSLVLGSTVGPPAAFPINTPVYLLQCVTYQVMQAGGANASAICGPNIPCLARGVAAPMLAGRIDCNGPGGDIACFAIAEGIEDLQLAYACDGCNVLVNGGTPDLVIDDQGVINNTFDATDFLSDSTWTVSSTTPDTIRLVRINVMAREAQNQQGFGEGNTVMANTSSAAVVMEDHNPSSDVGYAVATYRQFRRRAITRTVEVRNIGL
jgi:type IV pilus assembly protein PilW